MNYSHSLFHFHRASSEDKSSLGKLEVVTTEDTRPHSLSDESSIMAAKRPPGVAFTALFVGFADHAVFRIPGVTHLVTGAAPEDFVGAETVGAFFFGAFLLVASHAALDAATLASNNSSGSNQPLLDDCAEDIEWLVN